MSAAATWALFGVGAVLGYWGGFLRGYKTAARVCSRQLGELLQDEWKQ